MQTQISAIGMINGNKNGNKIIDTIAAITTSTPIIIAPISGKSRAKMQHKAKITIAQIPTVQPAALAMIVMPKRGINKKCQQSNAAIKRRRNAMMVFEVLLLGLLSMVFSLKRLWHEFILTQAYGYGNRVIFLLFSLGSE